MDNGLAVYQQLSIINVINGDYWHELVDKADMVQG